MITRCRAARCLALAVCACFLVGCYLASLPLNSEPSQPRRMEPLQTLKSSQDAPLPPANHKQSANGRKRLAVIVPFRDRFEELLDFVPHMYQFLNNQSIPFHIFVIHQRDGLRFNRASLINVGFLHVRADYDYIAMHDVDLLPINPCLRYEYPAEGPFHISAPDLHPKYHYSTFIGGILLISNDHFQLVNGLSNRYWGWGLEDDEFYVRLKDAGLTVRRPVNITTGTQNTFKHVHDSSHRRRDTRKCFTQREVTRRRDRVTGLHDLRYDLLARRTLAIDGCAVTVLDVRLECDRALTPWCLCDDTAKSKRNAAGKS